MTTSRQLTADHNYSPATRQRTKIGREGELRLRFGHHNGKTAMTESYFRTPLQVMQAIPDPAGCVGVYLLSPTGGVVQYDRYAIGITLEENAHALVTTVAATKVYRMPDGKAVQQITIYVGKNAILEFVPDALILFRDSDFEQRITIQLDEGAVCLFQDSIMGGRVAHHDEFLKFRRIQNQIEIRDADGLLVYDAMRFSPSDGDRTRIGLVDGYTCWGGAYIVGDLSRLNVDRAEFCQLVNANQQQSVLSSISELHRNGFAYRVLTDRLEFMEQSLEGIRSQLRHAMGIPYSSLRK